MDKRFKRYDKKLYQSLRVIFCVFAALVIEGIILRLLGFDNNNPLWLWGAWMVFGSTMCTLIYVISKVIKDIYKILGQLLTFIACYMWIIGTVYYTLNLSK